MINMIFTFNLLIKTAAEGVGVNYLLHQNKWFFLSLPETYFPVRKHCVSRAIWFARCSERCYLKDNPKVTRTFLVITLSSLLLLLFLEPVQNCRKSIIVLQPKLVRKQTGKDEQRRDNRPIILVPACFRSSCLLSCRPGDSNLPTKSLTGPLARESKHKNKESTFPAAGLSECWSSPEAIRSGRGLRAPIVSLYFGVWKTNEYCCFFLFLLLLHPFLSSLTVSLCASCFFFFFCVQARQGIEDKGLNSTLLFGRCRSSSHF